MPGLCGFAGSRAADADAQPVLRGMQELLRHRSYHRDHPLFRDGRVCATGSHLRLGSPPHSEGHLHAWLDGEVFNREELGRELGRPESTDAGLLAELVRRGDLSRLEGIDGIYAAVVYDGKAGVLHLVSDRYGLGHLYWTRLRDGIAWASEQKALLALPDFDPVIDRRSIEDFLAHGQLLEDRSWFEGVELVPAGAVLSWDLAKRARSTQHYWSWRSIEPLPQTVDPAELVEEMARRFRRAVERRARPGERIGINLSGGLDSRAVLAALPRGTGPVHALTFGSRDCLDWRIAARAAAQRGAHHHLSEIESDHWLRGRCAGVWWSDGQLGLLHMHGLSSYEGMRAHCDVSLNGFVGDAVAGGSLLAEGPEAELEVILRRVRRFTMQGIRLMQNFLNVRLPFVDNDLIDLLMAIPRGLRADSYIYNRMLLRHFPEYFRRIPWQRTGVSIARSRWVVRASRARRALTRRSRRWLARAGIAVRDRDAYCDYSRWLRQEPARHFAESILLDAEALYPHYLPRGEVECAWAAHLAGRDHSEQIGRLLSLEIWLRQLFEGRWRSLDDDPLSEGGR